MFFIVFTTVSLVESNSHASISLFNTALADTNSVGSHSENFEVFFSQFRNDVSLQRKNTQETIVRSFLDVKADPEPELVIKKEKKIDMPFPIMPNNDVIKKQHLDYKIQYLSKKKAKVIFSKKDTGFLVTYFFELRKCWLLVEILDEST